MSTKQSYEDLKPKVETKETPEAHLVLVHIPDGFAREHVGAKVEYDYGRIRVFGERRLENNTIRRFNEVHHVPAICDINRIKGKLEGGIITITMPKKVISKEVPSKKQEPTEKEAQETEPKQETEQKPDNGPEGTPQQSTTAEDQRETTAAAEVEDRNGHESINSNQDPKSTMQNKDKADSDETETPTQPEAKEESMPQKATSEDANLQREEKLTAPTDEKGEKPSDEETKEDKFNQTRDQEKQPEKEMNELGRKVPSAVVAESASLPKTTEKDQEKAVPSESTAKRIKEMAASASQAVTSFAKRFDEEDKQKLIYMGAAVLVVAIGVYASYKFRSSLKH